MVLPSGRTSQVKSIVTFDGDWKKLRAASVTVCLEDEIDISRGDMLVTTLPHAARIAPLRSDAWSGWRRIRCRSTGPIC